MRSIKYYLPILAGLLLLVTAMANFAMAGDPLKEDEDFLFGDPDNDEIFTWEEFLIGTDPYNSDSDNDGIPDFWEYVVGEMDPSDASDAHKDNDYDPSLNNSIGERDATFEAIKALGDGTQMTWPSDREKTFVEPVFDEDGSHYDNYEEYYRPYRDQNDNMKIKIMKTYPQRPDTDGDGILDPDDYEPFNFKNDGTGVGSAEAPLVKIDTKENVEATEVPNVETENNVIKEPFTEVPENNLEHFDFVLIKPEQSTVDNKKHLFDADNDGI
jgi:hypothetical protein